MILLFFVIRDHAKREELDYITAIRDFNTYSPWFQLSICYVLFMKVSEDYESMNATMASVHAFNFNLHGSKLKNIRRPL